MYSTIILIGPVNAGKSTIAALFSQRLGWRCCPLDDNCWQHYQEQGYDECWPDTSRSTPPTLQ
jgi:shikimate kinase